VTQSRQPLVSFVVPCYNYGRYLKDCLNSILTQESENDFEVVLIDDGSTDHTVEIIQSHSDPRIRVIRHTKNLGHVATINDGLKEARGEFIARIDPDDRYKPYFLQETLLKFRTFPEVDLVYGDVALINEQGKVTLERSDRVHGGRDFKGNELLKLLETNFICSAAVIARREAWLKTLPVPSHLAFHDWYFTVMMAREHDFYYINRVLADYRVHSLNHHSRVVQNKTEEPSIFWLLDQIFNQPEKASELEEQKKRVRNRVYGAQYLALANKYFGFQMEADAKRCYLNALRHQPQYFFRLDVIRHLMGALIGRRAYDQSKSVLKSLSRIESHR